MSRSSATPAHTTPARTTSYSPEALEAALDRHTMLKGRAPSQVRGNRSWTERVYSEDELNANARQWFREFEEQLDFYAGLGHDVSWVLDWTRKWWYSWLVRDMDLAAEICTPDLVYKDPVCFGKPLVGFQEFVDYNFAFFDALPDLRYDPLPGQSFLQINPDGSAQMMVRYIGTGHWDGPLKMYPFDDSAAAIPGNGAFMQCSAVDRYYWDADHRLHRGETLWDGFDVLQMSGLMPRGEGLTMKLLMNGLKVPSTATRLRRTLRGVPVIGMR